MAGKSKEFASRREKNEQPRKGNEHTASPDYGERPSQTIRQRVRTTIRRGGGVVWRLRIGRSGSYCSEESAREKGGKVVMVYAHTWRISCISLRSMELSLSLKESQRLQVLSRER